MSLSSFFCKVSVPCLLYISIPTYHCPRPSQWSIHIYQPSSNIYIWQTIYDVDSILRTKLSLYIIIFIEFNILKLYITINGFFETTVHEVSDKIPCDFLSWAPESELFSAMKRVRFWKWTKYVSYILYRKSCSTDLKYVDILI